MESNGWNQREIFTVTSENLDHEYIFEDSTFNEVSSRVIKFIQDNFFPELIIINDFPLFAYGKLIRNNQGGEMVIFFDLLTDSVKWVYPESKAPS